jgi:hypothetical protein
MEWRKSCHSFLDIGFERTEFVKRYDNPPHIFNKKISTHKHIDEIYYECDDNHHLYCYPCVITNLVEFESCVCKLAEWTMSMRKERIYFDWAIRFDELPHDVQFTNKLRDYWLPYDDSTVRIKWMGIDIDRVFDHILPDKELVKRIVGYMRNHDLLLDVSITTLLDEKKDESRKAHNDNTISCEDVSFEDVSLACTLQKIYEEGMVGCVLPPDIIDRIFVMATNGAYVPKREMKGIINQRSNQQRDSYGHNVEECTKLGAWEKVFFETISGVAESIPRDAT